MFTDRDILAFNWSHWHIGFFHNLAILILAATELTAINLFGGLGAIPAMEI